MITYIGAVRLRLPGRLWLDGILDLDPEHLASNLAGHVTGDGFPCYKDIMLCMVQVGQRFWEGQTVSLMNHEGNLIQVSVNRCSACVADRHRHAVGAAEDGGPSHKQAEESHATHDCCIVSSECEPKVPIMIVGFLQAVVGA